MGSSLILHRISAAGRYSLRSVFRSPNSCCGSKLGGRTISSSIRSDESSASLSSTLPSRTLPWFKLRPAFEYGDMVYRFYSFAQKRVLNFNKRGGGGGEESVESPDDDAEFVGSSHGWLALFNQHSNKDLFLSNPLSGRHIKLPPIHTLPIPEVNLRCGYWCVSKVIISGSPDKEECRAVMSFGPQKRLAFCCPRRSTEWTPIGALYDEDGQFPRSYKDFVYSSKHKLFFSITEYSQKGDIKVKPISAPDPPAPPLKADFEGWDLGDPLSPRIDWAIKDEPQIDEKNCRTSKLKVCWHLKYLVFSEQYDELFLVTRHINPRMGPDGSFVKFIYYDKYRGWDHTYPYKTIGFDVHKIDREKGKLRYMEGCLDGMAMFIGDNHSFALPASTEFPELKSNSIYFTDRREFIFPERYKTTFGGHDNGIFDYENRSLSSCYYPCDYGCIKRIVPPPMWFTPS